MKFYCLFDSFVFVKTCGELLIKYELADICVKGQLISDCFFGVLNFPKNQRKIWQISALESKKWSNQQIKALSYNNIIHIWLYGLFNVLKTL